MISECHILVSVSHSIAERLAQIFRLLLVIAGVNLAGFLVDAQRLSTAANALEQLEERMGSFHATFSVQSKQRDLDKDPDRVFDLAMTVDGLFAETRYDVDVSEQVIFYPDPASPAQPLNLHKRLLFNGERFTNWDVTNSRARIESQDTAARNYLVKKLWLYMWEKPIADYLNRPEAREIGTENVSNVSCVLFEVKDAASFTGQTIAFRFYLDPQNSWFPMRSEVSEQLPTGEFRPFESTVVSKVLRTQSGVPYPAEVATKVSLLRGNQRVLALERSYLCTSFTDNVALQADAFDLTLPNGTLIDDRIAGVNYRAGDFDKGVLHDMKSIVNLGQAMTQVSGENPVASTAVDDAAQSFNLAASNTVAVPALRYIFLAIGLIAIVCMILIARMLKASKNRSNDD